ncbi:hypothetical protein D3C78_1232420 [compost metagenome]
MRNSTPSGRRFCSSAMVARTLAEMSSAFEPGAWNTPMPTAGSLLSSERSA